MILALMRLWLLALPTGDIDVSLADLHALPPHAVASAVSPLSRETVGATMWWLNHGLAGWVVLSLLWGLSSIIYDVLIVVVGGGVEDTISWQTQQLAINNTVVAAAIGLVCGGLTIHFFKVRAWEWFDCRQPWIYYAAGFLAGAILVALTWTQRGGQ